MPTIAHVVVDVDVAHLDRPFDYLVPEEFLVKAHVGSLVRVMWGGRRVNGWIVSMADSSPHDPSPILAVTSTIPLFTDRMLRTYRYVAQRYCATLSQVLSMAIPLRRAAVEKELSEPPQHKPMFEGKMPLDTLYPGTRLVPNARIVATGIPHRVRTALAGLLQWASNQDIQVIITVPTGWQAKKLFEWLKAESGSSAIGLQVSETSPVQRFRTHVRALRGDFQVVVGTLAAVWSPVENDAIIVTWDGDSDLSRSRRTPQADALDIAVARSVNEGLGLIAASFSRTVKTQAMVESRWATEPSVSHSVMRDVCPKVRITGPESFEREGTSAFLGLPDSAFSLIRQSLKRGPVLIQVPGPGIEIDDGEVTIRLGAQRMGSDLGRAFPGTPVVVSASSTAIVRTLDSRSRIVIATPGAEPVVQQGYASVIVTEAHVLTFSERLDALDIALRRWFGTFAMAEAGAHVMLVGETDPQIVRALSLWNPVPAVRAQLAEREELGFFPARWMVALDGESRAVSEVATALEKAPLVPPAHIVGTVERESDNDDGSLFSARTLVRTILACKPAQAMELMREIQAIRIARSLERKPTIHVSVNPPELF